jgi:hypothetical protein
MYVTSVHGRIRTSAGTNMNISVTRGEMLLRMNITALAMMMRVTQGVI